MSSERKAVVDEDDARDNLDALVRQRGEQYAPLSRMIGQQDAYLRRWVRGDSCDRLPDKARYDLARHFGVDARMLGAAKKAA